MELLVLIACAQSDADFELFGSLTDGNEIDMYDKPLTWPLALRQAALVGFIRFEKGICLCIFEDGEVI